jgi:hypothetical protein
MITSQQHTPVSSDPRREDAYPRTTPPHLSACLAVSALVILMIVAINWLT